MILTYLKRRKKTTHLLKYVVLDWWDTLTIETSKGKEKVETENNVLSWFWLDSDVKYCSILCAEEETFTAIIKLLQLLITLEVLDSQILP